MINPKFVIKKDCVLVKNKNEYLFLMYELYKAGYYWRVGDYRYVPKIVINDGYRAYIFLYNNYISSLSPREDPLLNLYPKPEVFELLEILSFDEFENYWEYYYTIMNYDNNSFVMEHKRLLENIDKKDAKIRLDVVNKFLLKFNLGFDK